MEYPKEHDKIMVVINILCRYHQIPLCEFENFIKRKEKKYLFLLLLKNNKCLDNNRIKNILNVITNRSIDYNLNKAEEKFLINKEFREVYFDIEDGLKKII